MTAGKSRSTPSSAARGNSRGVAARIVGAWLADGVFPDRMLDAVMEDHAFILELVHGILRTYRILDWVRTQIAPRRPRAELDAHVLVGLYQLLFLDNVQDYAAVNETVSAAKAALGPGAARLVNAVLRRAQAREPELRARLERQPVGIRCSHPDLLISRWTTQFGAERAAALCAWNNERPRLALRINLARTTADSYLRSLRDAGLEAVPHSFAPDRFLALPHGVRVTELPGYDEGWFSVQDPSTQMAVDLLAPRPGERILDGCAAPGGKTILAAEAMKGQGTLVAMDPVPQRLTPLRQSIARLQLGVATVIQGDAARPETVPELAAEFDAVLLDVPCTNTGVIRRRPDVRWRFSVGRMKSAQENQRSIFDGVAPLVKHGGRLVYSTCSLEPEENENQVEDWLVRHPEFALAGSRRLFPPETGTDGAFAALLLRHV
jgi:16S rRNA (cytosine967-C5)-methyltransferase